MATLRKDKDGMEMTYSIFNEDAVKWAREYQGEKFHALFTDAPYHLTSIVKRFGKNRSAPAKFGTDGVFSRSSRGFMGQQWDGGDIAFQPETWEAFKGVMYDGAFGMAFSASRNWHRMAVAIEDAGFVIHPTMFFLWVQGQGFPKATKVRADGFEGYKYGLQALKPAVEPIIIFQKPYVGRPIDNIAETGAGVLNIDGARVPLQGDDEYVINEFEDGMKPFGNGAGHKFKPKSVRNQMSGDSRSPDGAGMFGEGKDVFTYPLNTSGRYPANLVLDEGSAEALDRQTGERPTGVVTRRKGMGYHGSDVVQENVITNGGDGGGASRFYNIVKDQIDENDPFYYCAKVNPKERNAGLNEFEEKVTTDGREKSIDNPYNRGETLRKNNHPTLKPIELCKHLATLLLPPAQYTPRRIFVPFSGVASEMIGACQAGWEVVVGVEFDKENGYVDIAERRLRHWVK